MSKLRTFIYRYVDPNDVPNDAEPVEDAAETQLMDRFFAAGTWAIENPAAFDALAALYPSLTPDGLPLRGQLFAMTGTMLEGLRRDVADNGPTETRTLLCRVPPPQELAQAAEEMSSLGLVLPHNKES